MIVVPFALLLIGGVLYGATQSFVDTFIIMAQIPVACLGGVLALIITGTSFITGSDRRLRATMMTDLVDALGLLPAAISTRIGAQTQQPLAIVVIGGALAIMLLTRILQPVLIFLCHRRLRLADQNRPPLTQPVGVDLPD
jgi:cobalt-zinc-cadmium resistance protein CzcA